MLVRPWSFAGVTIANYIAGYDAQSFQIPAPVPISQVRRVAGGGVFDFNYSSNEVLVPAPFTISFVVKGINPQDLTEKYDRLFAAPAFGGKIGVRAYFVVRAHGQSSVEYRALARMGRPVDTLAATWNGDDMFIKEGIKVQFKPVELFASF